LNLPARASGFIVKTVAKDSPGDQVGLRGSRMIVKIAGQDVPLGGDIVMSIEGISMSAANLAKVRDMLAGLPSGGLYKLSVLRAGQVLELTGKTP
jgi:hypothetical protein